MLFLTGDKRYASTGATFFFHQTSAGDTGSRLTKQYLKEKLKAVQYEDRRTAEIICHKTGQPIAEVNRWHELELTLTTEDALANGIIHEVREFTLPQNAFFHQVIV